MKGGGNRQGLSGLLHPLSCVSHETWSVLQTDGVALKDKDMRYEFVCCFAQKTGSSLPPRSRFMNSAVTEADCESVH